MEVSTLFRSSIEAADGPAPNRKERRRLSAGGKRAPKACPCCRPASSESLYHEGDEERAIAEGRSVADPQIAVPAPLKG